MGYASELGHLSLGFEPVLMLEPVEGRVERTLIDLQHLIRSLPFRAKRDLHVAARIQILPRGVA